MSNCLVIISFAELLLRYRNIFGVSTFPPLNVATGTAIHLILILAKIVTKASLSSACPDAVRNFLFCVSIKLWFTRSVSFVKKEKDETPSLHCDPSACQQIQRLGQGSLEMQGKHAGLSSHFCTVLTSFTASRISTRRSPRSLWCICACWVYGCILCKRLSALLTE